MKLRAPKNTAYYRSPEWVAVRSAAISRDCARCVDCGSWQLLQVHHIRYPVPIEETSVDDVITVCSGCHAKRHWADDRANGAVRDVGRPRQPESERIKHALPVKFSQSQVDKLRERAGNAGVTLSEWVKRELGLE